MVPARRAELLQLQPVLILLLILRRRVIAVLTIAALQGDDLSHKPTLDSGFEDRCPSHWHIDREDAIPSHEQPVFAVSLSTAHPETTLVRF